MWSNGRKVRCRQILHYRGSGGLRPIKIVIIITIPVNFQSGRRGPLLQAELNSDYLLRPINRHTTTVDPHDIIFALDDIIPC